MSLTIPHESFNTDSLRFVQTNTPPNNKSKHNNLNRICAMNSHPTAVAPNAAAAAAAAAAANIMAGANIIHSAKPNIQYSKVLYNTPHVTMSGISILFIYDKQNYSLDVEYIMNSIVNIESKVINKYVNHLKCIKKNRLPAAKTSVSFLSIYSQLYELLSQWHHLNKKYIIFRINNIQHNVENNSVGIVCQIY